jgi:hypothetical protein
VSCYSASRSSCPSSELIPPDTGGELRLTFRNAGCAKLKMSFCHHADPRFVVQTCQMRRAERAFIAVALHKSHRLTNVFSSNLSAFIPLLISDPDIPPFPTSPRPFTFSTIHQPPSSFFSQILALKSHSWVTSIMCHLTRQRHLSIPLTRPPVPSVCPSKVIHSI